MAEQESRLTVALQRAWPDLEPNQSEMRRLADRMTASMAETRVAVPAARHTGRPTTAGGSVEAQFRLLTLIWAVAAAGLYVAWPWLADWFDENPGWFLGGAVFVGIALLAPLLLLVVHDHPAQEEGGVTPC